MGSQQRARRLDDMNDDAHRMRVLGRHRRRRVARNGNSAGGVGGGGGGGGGGCGGGGGGEGGGEGGDGIIPQRQRGRFVYRIPVRELLHRPVRATALIEGCE